MVIFNLAICFAATFAWFTASKKLNGSEIGVQIDAQELHLEYELYKFDEVAKQVAEVETFALNTYDSIITEKNVNTPLIIKTVLAGNIFQNKSNTDVSINLTCSEAAYYTNYLSNIIHFKFAAFAINSTEAADIYSEGLAGLENTAALKFITTTKLTEINITITNAPIIDNTVTIYGLVNYDEDLISQFISVNELTLDVMPEFQNDLQHIRYSVHE